MNDSSENNTIKCAIISSKLVRWIYAGNIFWKVKKNQVIQSYFLKKRVVYQGLWGTSVQDWFVLSTSSSNSSIKQEETKQKNVESMVAKPNNSMWCCLDHCIPLATC